MPSLKEDFDACSAQLSAVNRELATLSHAIAHDLRAPLRHIAGFADLLEAQDGPRLTDKGQRHLATIQRSARVMESLIDQLIEYTRFGVADLHLGTVDLAALVREVLAERPPEAPDRDLRWDQGPLPQVRADPGLLKRALAQVLDNAVKFTRPRASALIEIGCRPEPGALAIHVRDNGIGFNPEYTPKLFGTFQRLHGDPELTGAGMGLAQVRRIMERHGGGVRAESDGRSGATFTLLLPD